MVHVLAGLAEGDLTHGVDERLLRKRDEVGVLAHAAQTMTTKLTGIVSTIQDSSVQIASSSEQITASAQKLAEGAQTQESTLEETSASVEELTASVNQVAEHAQSQAAAVEEGSSSMAQIREAVQKVANNLTEIATLAGKSVENAVGGAHAVAQVVDGINLIAASSEKVGGIVAVIADIADQTTSAIIFATPHHERASGKGTGLGLSTVYAVITQGGGSITASSLPGEGTHFTICLPRASGTREAMPLTPGNQVSRVSRRVVMVVEDDEHIRRFMRGVFQTHGYGVLTACDGMEALEVIMQRAGDIDALITDIIMPQMNGRELAEKVHSLFSRVPIVLVSGYSFESPESLEPMCGRVHFLRKPFTASSLVGALEMCFLSGDGGPVMPQSSRCSSGDQ